jgi:hypothetical protein
MVGLLFVAALGLQGSWFKPCEETSGHAYIHEDLQITGDQWVRVTNANRAEDCSGLDYLTIRQSFKARTAEPELDLQVVKISYEPKTVEETAILNSITFCGFEDWQINMERDVTGLVCNKYQMAHQGQLIYSVLSLRPREPRDLLFVGESTPNADGSSPEKRYIASELYAFERGTAKR